MCHLAPILSASLVVCLFLVEPSKARNDAYEPPKPSDIPSYYDDGYTNDVTGAFTGQPNDLEQYRETLVVIFGSNDVTNAKVYDRIDPMTDYWIWDDIGNSIRNQQNENRIILTQNQENDITEALELIAEKKTISIRPGKFEFIQKLNESRPAIDCEVGYSKTNSFYSQITKSVETSWDCYKILPLMWQGIVKADKDHCDLENAIRAIVEVGEAADDARSNQTPMSNSSFTDAKVDLLYTVSKPQNRKYLRELLCPDDISGCSDLQDIVCNAGYGVVLKVTHMLQNASAVKLPSSSAEMFVLLDIQSKLGEISNQFSIKDRSGFSGKDMLDYYMGIVDNAIGNSSVDVWKNMPKQRSKTELEFLLEKNEDFVGGASDLILGEATQNAELEKETLSVKMATVDGLTGKVEFGFPGAHIWTENISDIRSSGAINAYALYYKSWQEIQNQVQGSTAEGSANGKRWFVGKGGVISLSTRTNKEKKSVPVTYKMKFDASIASPNSTDSVKHRCLSCEYYDVTSKDWRSNGCYATNADVDGVTCHCNHTTNFAAFMSPFNPVFTMTVEEAMWLNMIEYAGSAFSALCLLASFITFCLVRSLVRNDRLRAHTNLAVALLFVHLIQLGADYAVLSDNLCVVTTVLTHYFLLAAFMWMLVEGIFLYLYVVQVFVHSKFENRWWMYAIGWGIPCVIVAISAGYGIPNDVYVQGKPPITPPCKEGQILYPPLPSDPKRDAKYATCWLNVASGMTWSFIGPALVVILFNIVILCKVVQVLVKLSERSKSIKQYNTSGSIGTTKVKQGYHMQQRPSSQVPSKKVSEFKSSNPRYVRSNSEEVSTQELHGNDYTSYSSRSPSQTYSQSISVGRPRAATVTSINETNYLSDIKTAIKGAAVLLPVLGIPWVCGMLGYKSFALTLTFVLLNSVQGVAIFLVYCVFNEEVCRALKRKYQLYRMKNGHVGRGRTSSTSSLKSAFNRGLLRSWRRRSTAISTLSTINNA